MAGKYRKHLGKLGENMAVNFLRRQGYKIIAKNFSCRLGEIDIIAHYEGIIIFVEVKTRRSYEYGFPEEAITCEKIKHLQRSAQFYIANFAPGEEFLRFDVLAIILGRKSQIKHIKNAF